MPELVNCHLTTIKIIYMRIAKNIIWVFIITIAISCGQRNKEIQVADGSPVNKYDEAINTSISYLFNNLYVREYKKPGGEICIPAYDILSLNDNDLQDIQVIGDFWIYYFNLSGDTLKTASSFNKHGNLHLWMMSKDKYMWEQFESVDLDPITKNTQRVFGDRLEEFLEIHADQERREAIRAKAIVAYVRNHGLSVKYFQDEGHPAVKLPLGKK